jgi:hypothetical protein
MTNISVQLSDMYMSACTLELILRSRMQEQLRRSPNGHCVIMSDRLSIGVLIMLASTWICSAFVAVARARRPASLQPLVPRPAAA